MNMESSHSWKVSHVALRRIRLYCGLTIYPFVFFSGFANLATEIIGPRMLSSLLGSSTTMWAVMISVTLVGLSAGYFVGGRLSLKWARKSLPVILFANALYLLAVSWVIWQIPPQAANYGIGATILIILLLFFAPAMFFGTISPIAVTLLSQNRNPDQMPGVSGNVYAIGTLGNIVGALSAAFILIPYVGLSLSLRLFSAGLVLFALYFWFANRSNAKYSQLLEPLSATFNHKDHISHTIPVNKYALFMFVLFSGFANLATEIIAPRMFASLLGPTTILWAIIISVTLIGLAVGYFAGGRIPLSHARLALYIILPLNAILLLAASWLVWELPILLLPITFKSIVLVALAAFFLPSVLFGMNSQIAITLLSGSRSFKNVSNAVGNVYATSTIGGVLGALSAALFFIPYVGLSTSLRWFAAGLILFELYFLVGRFRILALPLFAVCLLFPQPDWRWESRNSLTLLTQREGYYQTIRVYTNETTFVLLQLGPTYQSEMDINTREPRFGYARTKVNLVGDANEKRILLIGGAGHSMARALEAQGAVVTEVEIDPIVVQVSDEFFGPINGEVIVQDGRAFVEQSPAGVYDYVLIDAFNGPACVPAQLTTLEFFQSVGRILKSNGRMIMNFIGQTSGPRSNSFRALATTLGSAFDDAQYLDGRNIVFVASQAAMPDLGFDQVPTNGHLLSDDLNPIEIYLEEARRGFRFRR